MEFFKVAYRQDSHYKVNSGNSGETSINLSNEISSFIGNEGQKEIHIYKEDFIRALCCICELLPLYETSSRSSTQIQFTSRLFIDLYGKINNFFGENDSKIYKVNCLKRDDGRTYLNNLKYENFNLRDFLIEKHSTIKFSKTSEGSLVIRLFSNYREVEEQKSEHSEVLHFESFKLEKISTNYSQVLSALRTKPFLLLAGISGIGKSRIVREFAFATCQKLDSLQLNPTLPGNFCMIEVKPNWHDSTELLGYETKLEEGGNYVITPFISFLIKAMQYPSVPFFLCLDEMNLAPVEQYFAEYLSVLESRRKTINGIISDPLIKAEIFIKYIDKIKKSLYGGYIKNYDGTPIQEETKYDDVISQLMNSGLRIPNNLIIVGTVNMDETTHQFSRKVIDRAMTIEMNDVNFLNFYVSENNLNYSSTPADPSLFLASKASALDVFEVLSGETIQFIKEKIPVKLDELSEILKNTPFRVAYRVQNELTIYFYELTRSDPGSDLDELLKSAIDDILMMKVLPRIEGDEDLLTKPLSALRDWATGYPNAKRKIEEMQSRLVNQHFTSFWP